MRTDHTNVALVCGGALLATLGLLGACSSRSASQDDGGGGGQAVATTSASSGPTTVASTTSGSTSHGTSTGAGTESTGTGGTDPGWRAAPWWSGSCRIEVAQDPGSAFPAQEWTNCPGGASGCTMLVKNWPQLSAAAFADPVVRKAPEGYEMTLGVVMPAGETRFVLFDANGQPRTVYRVPPGDPCILTRLALGDGGHWIGGQTGGDESVYVFQPDGEPLEAAQRLPLTTASQQQTGGDTLFAIQRDFAAGIDVYDRTRGQVFSATANAQLPQVLDDAAFFTRSGADLFDMSAWAWSRSNGFQLLVDGGNDIVTDVKSDGEALVWIQGPPYDTAKDLYPAGVLYTSPYATTPDSVDPTARRAMPMIPVGAATTAGGGHYAAFSYETGLVHVVRLADAHMWTISIPPEEFPSQVEALAHVDADVVFFKTDTAFYRQELDALGAGTPAP